MLGVVLLGPLLKMLKTKDQAKWSLGSLEQGPGRKHKSKPQNWTVSRGQTLFGSSSSVAVRYDFGFLCTVFCRPGRWLGHQVHAYSEHVDNQARRPVLIAVLQTRMSTTFANATCAQMAHNQNINRKFLLGWCMLCTCMVFISTALLLLFITFVFPSPQAQNSGLPSSSEHVGKRGGLSVSIEAACNVQIRSINAAIKVNSISTSGAKNPLAYMMFDQWCFDMFWT